MKQRLTVLQAARELERAKAHAARGGRTTANYAPYRATKHEVPTAPPKKPKKKKDKEMPPKKAKKAKSLFASRAALERDIAEIEETRAEFESGVYDVPVSEFAPGMLPHGVRFSELSDAQKISATLIGSLDPIDVYRAQGHAHFRANRGVASAPTNERERILLLSGLDQNQSLDDLRAARDAAKAKAGAA